MNGFKRKYSGKKAGDEKKKSSEEMASGPIKKGALEEKT